MNNTEIKKQLFELQKDNPESILWDICEKVLVDEHSFDTMAEFLLSLYRDNGLRYDLANEFFDAHVDEIESCIQDNLELAKKYIDIETFRIDASFLAYQIVLQELLLDLGLLKKEDAHF
ncbi:MAG: hypothetical protein NXI10_03545 [bacterium]|nr:hypothetical protein [bacterium]